MLRSLMLRGVYIRHNMARHTGQSDKMALLGILGACCDSDAHSVGLQMADWWAWSARGAVIHLPE
jgi:hypothetical protein